jgi:hypothetical protein
VMCGAVCGSAAGPEAWPGIVELPKWKECSAKGGGGQVVGIREALRSTSVVQRPIPPKDPMFDLVPMLVSWNPESRVNCETVLGHGTWCEEGITPQTSSPSTASPMGQVTVPPPLGSVKAEHAENPRDVVSKRSPAHNTVEKATVEAAHGDLGGSAGSTATDSTVDRLVCQCRKKERIVATRIVPRRKEGCIINVRADEETGIKCHSRVVAGRLWTVSFCLPMH